MARLFQINPALDENAPACRCRQRADDRHRCGNHQCARTGDHEHDQRLVGGMHPCPAQKQRTQDGDAEREQENQRGVDRRETIDEPLDGRTVFLCLFDHPDDARDDGIGCACRHAENQHAAFVDRTGENGIAGLFVNRNAFAGDRRLVDGAASCRDDAVKRDALSRAYANRHAGFDGGYRYG